MIQKMLRLATDENFDNDILRSVRRIDPTIDIVRIQDFISGADDPTVLEWLASENRILLTHDVNTIPAFAYERINEGKPMPGVFMVLMGSPIARIAEDIILIATCSEPQEWDRQIRYLPLR